MLGVMLEAGKRMDLPITRQQLLANGIGSIVAGTDTTGVTLGVGAWAIFANNQVRSRLLAELKDVWPMQDSHPSLTTLERLPYLRACIRESLRLATPIPSRLPRIVPPEGLIFGGYMLPPGTSVCSSADLMHYDENVFPNPELFDPSRWLEGDGVVARERERQLLPFSEGSRKCIGLNVARAEIHIGLAMLIRCYKPVQLVEKELMVAKQFTTSVPGGLNVKLRNVEE